MADAEPSLATQWVACANANLILVKLATNLASYLAHPSDRDTESPIAVVNRLLGNVVLENDFHQNLTDVKRGQFDPDAAERLAMQMIGDALADIRRYASLET